MEIILIQETQLPLFSECIPESLMPTALSAGAIVLGALDDESHFPIGALLAAVTDSTLHIGWLYTLPEYRGQGVASSLLSRLAICLGPVEEIEQMIAHFPENRQSSIVAEFYRKLGFDVTTAPGQVYSFAVSDLANSSFWQIPRTAADIYTLGELTNLQLELLNEELAECGVCTVPLPVRRENYDSALSKCRIKENRVGSVVLIKSSPGAIDVSFVYAQSGLEALPAMLYLCGREIIDRFSAETPVSLSAVTDTAQALVNKLFPGMMPVTEIRAIAHIVHNNTAPTL